jgi:hypothetical protein
LLVTSHLHDSPVSYTGHPCHKIGEPSLIFLKKKQLTRFSVAVSVPAMRVSVFSKEQQSEQVDEKSEGTNDENHLGVVDLLGVVEPLQALHADGEAERDQKDSVHKSTQNLGTGPSVSVLKWREGRYKY